jgi:putative toxin-antitoxin system antitoxin component (TIGR02293 family)
MALWPTPTTGLEILHKKVLYMKSVGIRARNLQQTIDLLRKGLPTSSLDKLHRKMGISNSELARITHIAIRTLQRRKKQGRFNTCESERLLRIEILFDKAVDVLGDVEAARAWIKTPVKALAGETPLDYCDTEPGAREVGNLLGRIEHGVFS